MGAAVGVFGLLPRAKNVCRKAVKFTLPSPVTGSQPVAAGKPSAQQMVASTTQLLMPLVMSLRIIEEDRAYRDGLIQPRLDLPADNLAALTSETIAANTCFKQQFKINVNEHTKEKSQI